MDFEERPLLHVADFASALLRAAGSGPATVDDAARLLGQDLVLAHEPPPDKDVGEFLDHLAGTRDHLAAAQLLEMLDEHRFRITPRGRAMLHRHPDGIDDTVLMAFPEFRGWLSGNGAQAPEDARGEEFEAGWSAQREGRELTDNPFPSDTAQHGAWEDGWLEASRRAREGS